MESLVSKNIKDRFISFSGENGFVYHGSEPLIAKEDSRLLFNISGGVKYQDELLELKESDEKKVSSIQRCLRTDGMKSIGYSGRHHLFFEMLGHFMFYESAEKETKEEFIKFAYDFLVKVVGLDKNRLFVTVHPQDIVTLETWKKLGNNNILLTSENTFTSPYADKSALRTEIKWQRDDDEKSLVELWNLVFTQFDSKEVFINPSSRVGADSGASLERIVSAYENKSNNYENSIWLPYINYLSSLSSYESIDELRRLADFLNASVNMIDEGIIPGNKVQPYVLRKILRTIFDMCDTLGLNYEDAVIECIKRNNININRKEELLKIYKEELKRYDKSIENGLAMALKMISKNGNVNRDFLKSTCGLPDKYIDKILSGDDINDISLLVKKRNN